MATRELSAHGGHPEGFAGTLRSDRWWLGPALTVAGLGLFAIYATWAALQGGHYYNAPYLSPFYSPPLLVDVNAPGSAPVWHALLGEYPVSWPSWIPKSPAILILVFPGLFRFTCYYYRKAYYRSFAGSPPACGVVPVAKNTKKYHGESNLLIFQNLHRYALYPAILYIPILYADAFAALTREGEFGIGVGTIVLFANATLLSGYTFGCHSFRHLIGGRTDCMSCGSSTVKYRLWKRVSWLNVRHMNFAWASLFWVMFTDLYVRLVSMGVIHDFNTWGE